MDTRFAHKYGTSGVAFQKYLCSSKKENFGIRFESDLSDFDKGSLVRSNRESDIETRFHLSTAKERWDKSGASTEDIDKTKKEARTLSSYSSNGKSIFAKARNNRINKRTLRQKLVSSKSSISKIEEMKEVPRSFIAKKKKTKTYTTDENQTVARPAYNSYPSTTPTTALPVETKITNERHIVGSAPVESLAQKKLQEELQALKSNLSEQRKEMEGIKEEAKQNLKESELARLENEIKSKTDEINNIKNKEKITSTKVENSQNPVAIPNIDNNYGKTEVQSSEAGRTFNSSAASNVSRLPQGSSSKLESNNDFMGTPIGPKSISENTFPSTQSFNSLNSVMKTLNSNETKLNASSLELMYKNTKPTQEEAKKRQSELKKMFEAYTSPIPAGDGYFILNKNADESIGFTKISKEKYNKNYKNISLKNVGESK